MRVVRAAMPLLLAAALAPPSHAAAPAPDSGVAGTVRAGSSRALPRAARVVVRDRATGRTVARAKTVRLGRFRIPLEPGRYSIRATVPGVRGIARRAVTVRAHRVALVALWIDVPQRGDRRSERRHAGLVPRTAPPRPRRQ